MKMKSLTYNFGKSKKGLYCDINGEPQAYNVLLFLKAQSGRSKKGVLKISTQKVRGFIKLKLRSQNGFWSDYEQFEIKTGFKLVSLSPSLCKAKTIWVYVKPNKLK